MRYKAILFDMDGTLLDTLADMVSAVNHILSVHGWPQRTTEEVRAFVGNGARRLMERAVPPDVTGGAFEAVLAAVAAQAGGEVGGGESLAVGQRGNGQFLHLDGQRQA